MPDILPERMLKEVREDGWQPVMLHTMLEEYYKLRGWDASGIPTKETLEKLNIPI